MTRIRMFLFYTLMAWASIVSPKEGSKMIDDAELGAAERQRAGMRLDMHRNGRRQIEAPSNTAATIALLIAIAVTAVWAWCIAYVVAGWLS